MEWKEICARLQDREDGSDWLATTTLAVLAPWLEDPEPIVRAAAREEIDSSRARQEESAAFDVPDPIVAGGSNFDDHLAELLLVGRPPVAFGTSIEEAARSLPGFRREPEVLVLGEIELRFGAEGAGA